MYQGILLEVLEIWTTRPFFDSNIYPQFFTKKAVTEAWPRGAALAEATWSGQRRPGFSDFQRRLQLLQPLLRQNQDGTCQKWKHFKDAVNDLKVFSLSRFFPR